MRNVVVPKERPVMAVSVHGTELIGVVPKPDVVVSAMFAAVYNDFLNEFTEQFIDILTNSNIKMRNGRCFRLDCEVAFVSVEFWLLMVKVSCSVCAALYGEAHSVLLTHLVGSIRLGLFRLS